jgi:hypothetical protein
MPPPRHEADYYRNRAKEARAQAAEMDDPFEAMALLELAFVYELTAIRAEARRNNAPYTRTYGQRRSRRT